ncbi:MAG: type II toxin-antitoxin system HipA family toxin [Candidatus Binatia bacterium]
MTSENRYRQAYVWIWLPGETSPVVAGRLAPVGARYVFRYGKSYLARANAISIHQPELPLQAGPQPPLHGLTIAGCLRDASPDAWGRRVILHRELGQRGPGIDPDHLNEIAYMLESHSDRTGALDFQRSPTAYEPREVGQADLGDLLEAADRMERGLPLGPELEAALLHGTSIGGARPKARITSDKGKFVAKFSSHNDLYSVVKAEFLAMRLAAEVGLDVAPVELRRVAGKDVLLVARFDRRKAEDGWQRRAMVSALTLLELDELMARYASYENLATIVRHRFTAPRKTLEELFGRMLFNVLCGNTDDHARNHAAFRDGTSLSLTPAFDICPQARSGNEATQAMRIVGDESWSRVETCLRAAPAFLLGRERALAMARSQVEGIRNNWSAVCSEAGLTEAERSRFWRRQFLNPFVFEGGAEELENLL